MLARLKKIEIDVDVHRAIETARRSFPESENEILRRLLLDRTPRPTAPSNKPKKPAADRVRSRGLWSIEVNGEREPVANLKEAYRALLLKLNETSPEFIERFASERSRSRRFVARRPGDLYLSSPHLAEKFARTLTDGWYFDTNLSSDQVSARVRAAARIAGMTYGRDIKLLENLRLI